MGQVVRSVSERVEPEKNGQLNVSLTKFWYGFIVKKGWQKHCMAFNLSLTKFWYGFISINSWQKYVLYFFIFHWKNSGWQKYCMFFIFHWQTSGMDLSLKIMKINTVDKITIQLWPQKKSWQSSSMALTVHWQNSCKALGFI